MLIKKFTQTAFGLADYAGSIDFRTGGGSGVNLILAGTPKYSIVVIGYLMVVDSDVMVDWEDSYGNVLSGAIKVSATGGNQAPGTEFGQFVCRAGYDLELNVASGVAVGGHLMYALLAALI